MKIGNYAKVPYDAKHRREIRALAMMQGSAVAAFGRWQIMLLTLYQYGGIIELNDITRADLCSELELDASGLDTFLGQLVDVDLISASHLARGIVANDGVCKELAYLEEMRERGKKGGRPKKENQQG